MRNRSALPLRALVAATITTAAVSLAAPLAHADNQHDCELFHNADLTTKIQAAVDSMQRTAKSNGVEDLTKNSATTIVAYQSAGDTAGQLATDLQSQPAQTTMAKLHDDLYTQADAFEATIKEQGSQASIGTLQSSNDSLKNTISDYRQAVNDACGH